MINTHQGSHTAINGGWKPFLCFDVYCNPGFEVHSEEVFVVYGCKDESTMVSLPVSLIEEHIDALNISKDDDGKITHWHMVFFKDVSGNMTWLLSKPNLQEISIDKYIM